VVPTVRFKVLFVLVVLRHHRRQVVHFSVTEHPTAEWTAQQTVGAFRWGQPPRHLLTDRDGVYGRHLGKRGRGLASRRWSSPPRAPGRAPAVRRHAERLIGSIRRECLDHVIVLNEDHLRRILRSYFSYYHH